VSEREYNGQLRVPAEHACFTAHFPGQPLVPGALLLQWLCQRVAQQFPQQRVVKVASMKFLRPLLPGDVCALKMRCQASRDRLRVELVCAGEMVCRGVLIVRSDEAKPS
jgi:3-hydroxymyristoyl/3-hydroxydecanoyl-(acyl carrier protein) dehydratase